MTEKAMRLRPRIGTHTRSWIDAKMLALKKHHPPGFVKVSDSDLKRLEECILLDYEPTHCSKCGDKLKPATVTPGLPGSGRVVLGGWYTIPGSKDPLCPSCAMAARFSSSVLEEKKR